MNPPSRDITTLDLAPSVCDTLLRNGFRTVDDIVSLKPFELSRELSITPVEATKLISAVSESIQTSTAQVAVSALDMCKKANSMRPIITFCKAIDQLLGGGVQIGQLTEFCGVPGVGKTQLGIQLVLDAQIPELFTGNGGESVYIDTEGSFMVERVAEMAQALSAHLIKVSSKASKHLDKGAGTSSDATRDYRTTAENMTVNKLLQGIHVFRAHNQVEQISIINSLSAFLKVHPNIKIIVIDSIAFHFRQDLQEASARSRILSSIAQTLNQLAFDHSLAVVTINHITTRVTAGSIGSTGGSIASSSRIIPALGEQWSHCVTNRVMMFWQQQTIRTACLIKSPDRAQGLAHFTVNIHGIRDHIGGATGTSTAQSSHNVISRTNSNTSTDSSSSVTSGSGNHDSNNADLVQNDLKRPRY